MDLGQDERTRMQAYAERLQAAMNLTHWTITVQPELDEEPGVYATIDPTRDGHHATLRAGDRWADLDAPGRRKVMVHELLHLIHRSQTDVVRIGFPATGLLPDPAWNGLWEVFSAETERMVDAIAEVLAPFMPEWTW